MEPNSGFFHVILDPSLGGVKIAIFAIAPELVTNLARQVDLCGSMFVRPEHII